LLALREQYPEVGVWGPGIIEVEFHKDTSAKFNNFKAYYQEKAFDKVQFGKERRWMPYYPSGTGMCLTKEVATAYLGFLKNGRMTATDRKGKSLSSGGDSQVVYSAILIDLSAGTSPSLSVNHLTSKKKSNLNYLKRLQFGIYSCTPVHTEVFPELKDKILKPKLNEFLELVLRSVIQSRFGKYKSKFQLPLAKELGGIQGYYDTFQLSVPWVYRFFINKLGLR